MFLCSLPTRMPWLAKVVRWIGGVISVTLYRSPLGTSYSTSFLVHVTLILVLACVTSPTDVRQRPRTLTVLPGTAEDPRAPIVESASNEGDRQATVGSAGFQTNEPQFSEFAGVRPGTGAVALDLTGLVIATDPVLVAEGTAASTPREGSRGASGTNLLLPVGGPGIGSGLEGRGKGQRPGLARSRGGSAESEDAVGRGLAWLAAHQRKDGAWRFNHEDGPCRGLCANPGSNGSTTAATGLALLPFLGAGEVGQGSPYKEHVERGLYYLTSRLIINSHGGDLQEGTMYGQGIAGLALCEAYAMTGDATLKVPAQKAIEFICDAQHAAGGWRYAPGLPGDTTVLGWQLMALKSARMAGLDVPRSAFYKAEKFLDSVQTEKGSFYGYMKPGKLPTSTAVGLLMRMYSGWRREDPRLARGAEYLEKLGPSKNDVYFNFYASQMLNHFGGDGWKAWNLQLRDRLIATQARHGHEHGSWYFVHEHGEAGGRLYTTAMCLLTLEVYYRYLPLYGSKPVEEEF
jgi:hypothetical protein